jgi:hypothetical protein
VVGYGVGSIVGGHLALVGHIVGAAVSHRVGGEVAHVGSRVGGHLALVGHIVGVVVFTCSTLGDCFTDGSSVGG